MELNNIFFGNTPADQRKFLRSALEHLKSSGHKRVIVPCCGQFALVKAAIEAGFRPQDIEASEVSLFSNLLGFFYADLDVDTLGFKIVKKKDQNEYLKLKTQVEKVAFLLFRIKLAQLRTRVYYEMTYYIEMQTNEMVYRKQIENKLAAHKEIYRGIQFSIEDLRTYFERNYSNTDILLVNPPAYAKGYTKMYQFGDYIEYEVPFEEWDLKTEYDNSWNKAKKFKCPVFFYRYKEVNGFPPKEVVFAKEYTTERHDFWLCTKPKLLNGLPVFKDVVKKKSHDKGVKNYEIFGLDDKITAESEVAFKQTDADVALYYRDLFAHKLGVTAAEFYYLILIDKKVVGVVGWHTSALRSMRENKIFEVFCFNVPNSRYPTLNRLMMMYLTCREMYEVLMNSAFKTNRFFDLQGVKTTCLSRYRKVKLNNGLLTIVKREKMKNDLYKMVYETEWHERGFQECNKAYLDELKIKSNGESV